MFQMAMNKHICISDIETGEISLINSNNFIFFFSNFSTERPKQKSNVP